MEPRFSSFSQILDLYRFNHQLTDWQTHGGEVFRAEARDHELIFSLERDHRPETLAMKRSRYSLL
jgi:hypothetical protein